MCSAQTSGCKYCCEWVLIKVIRRANSAFWRGLARTVGRADMSTSEVTRGDTVHHIVKYMRLVGNRPGCGDISRSTRFSRLLHPIPASSDRTKGYKHRESPRPSVWTLSLSDSRLPRKRHPHVFMTPATSVIAGAMAYTHISPCHQDRLDSSHFEYEIANSPRPSQPARFPSGSFHFYPIPLQPKPPPYKSPPISPSHTPPPLPPRTSLDAQPTHKWEWE